ncbi:hypothetical protein NSP_8010 [Nodularia spumigena CCY9414]|nr:hypothetical protein NSP_8010 [Nodularia spumigena CCY9414]
MATVEIFILIKFQFYCRITAYIFQSGWLLGYLSIHNPD